jgi:hypothetical protein
MSPPPRPEGECRSAQREGGSAKPPACPQGECRSAQREGSPVRREVVPRAGLLVIAVGNRSRGDDALGPLLLDRLERWRASGDRGADLELLEDFQLQIEHALDLAGRRLVLFVDAGTRTAAPFVFYATGAAAPGAATAMRWRRRPCWVSIGRSPATTRRRHSCCACAARLSSWARISATRRARMPRRRGAS